VKQIIANAPLTNFAATQVLPRIAGADPETGAFDGKPDGSHSRD
jgi:hypothetical protein